MKKHILPLSLVIVMVLWPSLSLAHPPADQKPDTAYAEYIANEGVLVVDGDTKILFDPLFHNSFGQYRVPSEEQRIAILKGTAPFDGVDMLFISHAHGDHFADEDVLVWLNNHPDSTLVAPQQAVDNLKKSESWKDVYNDRIIAIAMELGEDAKRMKIKRVLDDNGVRSTTSLEIDAVRIPHAGWPGRASVQNIVYRVTLGDDTTVMHLGDADPNDEHYAPYEDLWAKRDTDLGFPPYWFFSSPETHNILKERLRIKEAIGIHVPVNVPPGLNEAREKHGIGFFSEPGEWHPINPDAEKSTEHGAHTDQ